MFLGTFLLTLVLLNLFLISYNFEFHPLGVIVIYGFDIYYSRLCLLSSSVFSYELFLAKNFPLKTYQFFC
ncbi:MAG: hypothetical protein Pg6B_06940 [Candidatus Azobacteroides pseudotrichonymphae]|jgi:hypothetical protein|nr:MAG: hypothetical protein Pg6B_06940 [Candidatus Azobacteroides pseudotrichonymphae]